MSVRDERRLRRMFQKKVEENLELLREYQQLVHKYEELRRESGTGHRDEEGRKSHLDGSNP